MLQAHCPFEREQAWLIRSKCRMFELSWILKDAGSDGAMVLLFRLL